jgi:hypothetical protein
MNPTPLMKFGLAIVFSLFLCCGLSLRAADLDPALQAKLDGQVKLAQTLASNPVLINAVKAQNAALPPELAAMTQDKWKTASVLDPVIRKLSKNEAAEYLRANKDAAVSEAFVSDAEGFKVGFLGKTSAWCHKGKPKHDLPMSGKNWQGEIEVDASSGVQQVQISVPVLDGGKPIGSLVVGLAISRLK